MSPRVDRREFLRRSAWVTAAPLVLPQRAWAGPTGSENDPRVVHVHHAMAARCPSAEGLGYRDYVDQEVVFRMLDEAVGALAGGTIEDAWSSIFSLGAPETRRLSIKVNCNNATDSADGAGDIIDAIPEPAVAVIRGFVMAGGLSSNCTIFDATTSSPQRHIATWFREKVRSWYPDVHFNELADGPETPSVDAFDPRTHVTWDPAYTTPPPETRLTRLVLDADYLVNIPIVKRHGQANVTLGYKNHLGCISDPGNLHPYLYEDVPEASVLADIMGSPFVPDDPSVKTFAEKTALTVGDMLYGQACSNWGFTPKPWALYGGEWPNCLFVSKDPVAADSVMLDVLEAEPPGGGGCGSIRSWARRYLQFAEDKGQGIHESVDLPGGGQRFDPAWMTYSRIAYDYRDLWPSGAELRCTRIEGSAVLLEWEHYFPGLCEIHRATRPDFSDVEVLGASPTGQYIDSAPPEPAFYQILYIG